MTHTFIDWDADGAFLSLTRPGSPAEEVRLSECDVARLMQEAAQAWLRTGRQMVVTPARWPRGDKIEGAGEPLIGHFGE